MSGHLFSIQNNPAGLKAGLVEVNRLLRSRGCPPDLVRNVHLGLEEVITNILKYGYDDSEAHQIDISLELTPAVLRLTVSDDGHEFDPLRQTRPDTTRPVDEREAGGLGLHVLRALFDAVHYRREHNRNVLDLENHLPPE